VQLCNEPEVQVCTRALVHDTDWRDERSCSWQLKQGQRSQDDARQEMAIVARLISATIAVETSSFTKRFVIVKS
jgi:hypothetical protein